MKKLLFVLFFALLWTSVFAGDVIATFDFSNPSSISPYYPNGTNLTSVTTWQTTSDSKAWVKTTPVGSGNKYGNVSVNGQMKTVLALMSGSSIRVGLNGTSYIKKISFTCSNTAANITSSMGSLSSSYSSDFSSRFFEWTATGGQYLQVIFSVSSTLATFSNIKVTYSGDTTPSTTLVSAISLSKSTASLNVGDALSLTANVSPSDATNKNVTWSSSKTSVATVSQSGVVTAKSAGSAIITATASDGGGAKATCTVTVKQSQATVGLVENFEWQENNNTVEVAVGGKYQLHYNCTSNSSIVFTEAMASNWVHYDLNSGQRVVQTPTAYSISESGVLTGLKEGKYAMKFTGYIQAKAGADKWLYINVVSEPKEKESNNTLDTSNEITTSMRFGLSNAVDIDCFRFKHNFSFGTYVTFKVHYYGSRENPFGYKWSTYGGDKSLSGSGSLMTQDQECKALVSSGKYVYFQVYYDPNRTQYFNYGEEFVVEIYVNGEKWTGEAEVVKVSSIKISEGNCSAQVGRVLQLHAEVSPQNATDKSVTWSSSNTSVCTIDSNGQCTTVGVGKATITAKANDGSGVKGTCTVTVEPIKVSSIALSLTSATLKPGEKLALSASVAPSDATDKTIVWSSSNASVVKVDNAGIVTAVGVGKATITAKANDGSGVKSSCTIEVIPTMVTSVVLSHKEITLTKGESVTLDASVGPEDADNKLLTWTSSDEGVAFVSANGKVVALGLGSAYIIATATDGSGVADTCLVAVTPVLAKSIVLSESAITLTKGQNTTLTATVLPADANDKTVTWRSDNEAVALISTKGKVVALECGIAVITATCNDGSGVYATCVVTVEPSRVTDICLAQDTVLLKVGQNAIVEATALPDDAVNKNLSWSSDNEDVVIVGSNGRIVALYPGTATITISSTDGSNVSKSCVVIVEEDTAISTIKADETPAIIYRIDGSQTSKMSKGINILRNNNEEGKKVIIM